MQLWQQLWQQLCQNKLQLLKRQDGRVSAASQEAFAGADTIMLVYINTEKHYVRDSKQFTALVRIFNSRYRTTNTNTANITWRYAPAWLKDTTLCYATIGDPIQIQLITG